MRAKKTEKLEVRLPPEAKKSFLDRCRVEGRSASEVIRHLIEPASPPVARAPLPTAVVWLTRAAAICALIWGGFLLAVTLMALGWDLRPGLIAYNVLQGGLYVAAGVGLLAKRWSASLLVEIALASLQIVYVLEVNPPGPLAPALWGVFGGGAATLPLLAATAMTWVISMRRQSPRAPV